MAAIFATAWIALACWALALHGRAGSRRLAPWARALWTLGCLANLAHVAAALHVVHGWDFADAYALVARRTHEQIGFAWGAGVYFNYAFTLLWLLDAGWWWTAPTGYERRSAWAESAVQLFFLFMFFNATVVFGLTTGIRVVGLAACLVAAGSLVRIRRKRVA